MTKLERRFLDTLVEMPIIAVLRGLETDRAASIGHVIVEAGIRLIEVPLNSPTPLESIAKLHEILDGQAIIGAGTVLSADAANQVCDAGGQIIVSPSTDADVIGMAKKRGAISIPGFFTPTEAFTSIQAGADALKLFPAENAPPSVCSAMLAVLPRDIPLIAVGGIDAHNMEQYWNVGVRGFGIGSAMFQPGFTTNDVARRARRITQMARKLMR